MKENKELKKELYHMKIMNQINNKVDDMKLWRSMWTNCCWI